MCWDDDYGYGNKRMDSKSKHPFAITCRKCGSNDIRITAWDRGSLEIQCQGCGFELDCGAYYTQEYDYSDM